MTSLKALMTLTTLLNINHVCFLNKWFVMTKHIFIGHSMVRILEEQHKKMNLMSFLTEKTRNSNWYLLSVFFLKCYFLEALFWSISKLLAISFSPCMYILILPHNNAINVTSLPSFHYFPLCMQVIQNIVWQSTSNKFWSRRKYPI